MHVKYDSENMEYEASFFKESKSGQEFIFSLKFYITNKFLEKMWIEQRKPRKRNISSNKRRKKLSNRSYSK